MYYNINMKKLLTIFIICILFVFPLGCINSNKEVYKVDVISGTTTEYTDFDHWLLEEVGVKATPSHVFINNGKITNHIDYTINNWEFKAERKSNTISIDLWSKPLIDIDGNEIYLKDFDIIYIVRPGCDSCEEQEKLYQNDIYTKNNNLRFLVYHIVTDELDCSDGCS